MKLMTRVQRRVHVQRRVRFRDRVRVRIRVRVRVRIRTRIRVRVRVRERHGTDPSIDASGASGRTERGVSQDQMSKCKGSKGRGDDIQ